MIKFCKTTDAAGVPTLATDGSAGFDLYSNCMLKVMPGYPNKILTGISCHIPAGYVGLIKSRSSLSVRYGMQILGGVIDSDYRGEIIVIAAVDKELEVSWGERIAQLVVVPCLRAHEVVESLDETYRGSGGFGSTGK